MKIVIGIILLLWGIRLFFRYKMYSPESSMTEEEKEEFARFREQEEKEQAESQAILQKLVVYRTLRASIHAGMSLEEMIDAFAEMCRISVGDPDNLLFEAGTYSFTGEKMFYFSLVRQFQFMDAEEYVQLRLDVLYAPEPKTRLLHCTRWDSRIDGDFFTMVKESRVYEAVQNLPIAKVDIRIEET